MENRIDNINSSEYYLIIVDSVYPISETPTNDGLIAFSAKRFMANHHNLPFTQDKTDMQKKLSIVTAEFDSCEEAIEAIDLLLESGLEEENISIIGKYKLLEELMEEESHLMETNNEHDLLSSLNNFGMIEIPSIDTIFVAGALMGKYKINGTIASATSDNLNDILKNWGLNKMLISRYFDHIANNKTLILAVGSLTQIGKASSTLKYDTMAKYVDLFARKPIHPTTSFPDDTIEEIENLL